MTQIDDYTERVKQMVGKVHLQRHHPLRARHLRLGGRRGGTRPQESPPHADQQGELCTILTTHLSPISTAYPALAHGRLEEVRSIGKIVLEGWEGLAPGSLRPD